MLKFLPHMASEPGEPGKGGTIPAFQGDMKYKDAASYKFHARDFSDRCYKCARNSERLLVVRQIASMMLVHLCPNCMLDYTDDYLLDNTRPWTGGT